MQTKEDFFPNAPGLSKHLGLIRRQDPMRRTKGIWPFRYKWYSICSRHQGGTPGCSVCEVGSWENTAKLRIMKPLFKYTPRIWFFLNNSQLCLQSRIRESYNFEKPEPFRNK